MSSFHPYGLGKTITKKKLESEYTQRVSHKLSQLQDQIKRIKDIQQDKKNAEHSSIFQEKDSVVSFAGSLPASSPSSKSTTFASAAQAVPFDPSGSSLPPLPSGCQWKPLPSQLQITAAPSDVLDGKTWTVELNKRLDAVNSPLPRFPFLLAVYGGIGSGKTNIACYMLSMYAEVAQPQNITVVTPLGELDPTLRNTQFHCPKETKFTISETFPARELAKDTAEILRSSNPVLSAARQGSAPLYKELVSESRLLPDSDMKNPYHDIYGEPIQHSLRPPGYLVEELEKQLEEHDQSSWFVKNFKNRRHHPFSEFVRTSDNVQRALLSSESGKLPISSIQYELWRMKTDPLSSVMESADTQFKTAGRSGLTMFKEKEFENRVLVLDDIGGLMQDKETRNSIIRYSLTLRHLHGSMIITAQRPVLIPPAIRGQATQVILFPVRNGKELNRIKDEYGSRIPNFDKVFAAACVPTPELPVPFLYADFTKTPPYLSRGFQAEIQYSLSDKPSSTE